MAIVPKVGSKTRCPFPSAGPDNTSDLRGAERGAVINMNDVYLSLGVQAIRDL